VTRRVWLGTGPGTSRHGMDSMIPVDNERRKTKKLDDSGCPDGGNGGESRGPTFDEVVRKMLNTPPKPKKPPEPKKSGHERRARRERD
jgi:hypothetical protein